MASLMMIESDDGSSTTTTNSTASSLREDVAAAAVMGIDYSVDSAIRYYRAEHDNSGEEEEEAAIQRRIGHISSIWPITKEGGEEPVRFVYHVASAFMGLEHFNNRNGVIIPELPDLLRGCDFQMTMDIRNDQFNRRKAVEALMNATTSSSSSSSSSNNPPPPPPFAILGSLTSGVSSTVSILADALQIVQMTGTSTSPTLDDSRHFTRTVPTNEGESAAIMNYFRQTSITSRVGILYVQDAYGEGFSKALFKQAILNNITVAITLPYQENEASVNTSMALLKASEVRYIIFVQTPQYWKPVVRAAYKHGIMGPQSGRQWYFPEEQSEFHNDFSLDKSTEADIAEALHGMGFVQSSFSKRESFEREFQKFLLGKEGEEATEEYTGQAFESHQTTNSTTNMLERFISSHLEPQLYDNAQFTPPKPSPYLYYMYDAIMALGIAACRTPGQFTTEEFLSQLLESEFPGASGHVALDRKTGSRQVKDIDYEVVNFLLSPSMTTNSSFRFVDRTTAFIQGTNVTHLEDQFVYPDNTTIAPPDLPPTAPHDYNLIPMWALAIGWVLGGLALLTSVGFASWTIYHRHHHVVRISQPVFLCQLCLGTFIMATAIIPLSMQEQEDNYNNLYSKWNLDAACMAVPWLKWIGFATAVSAILAKTLRLNKLIKKSRGMKRVVVNPTDVLQPLIVLMGCNIILLVSCTLVAPFTWQRIPSENNMDRYGRSLESFGSCEHFSSSAPEIDSHPGTFYFMLPICIVNFVGLGVAAWHCYKARHLPTEMSESRYLFVATISLMEVSLIGGPIVFLPTLSPTALYLVVSSMISLACFSILLPIFLPKCQQHKTYVSQRGRRTFVDMSTMKKRTTGRASTWTNPQPTVSSMAGEFLDDDQEWGRMSVVRNSAVRTT